MIVIRRSRGDDASGLSTCIDAVARERRYLATVQGFSAEQTQAYISSLEGTKGVQFVALEGTDIIGWGDVVQMPQEGMRHVGRLGMGVAATHRGQGIGKQLLDKLVLHAFDNNLTRVELEVFASNRAAIKLYQGRQFAIEGRKLKARLLDGVEDDILIMALCRFLA